mmetsp:Transcript_35695/g.68676  ORF Transcript_35695/g.68676 Transcript_35695/m.68676 type:complete len:104 (+) Transcript_35695:148-459(+)
MGNPERAHAYCQRTNAIPTTAAAAAAAASSSASTANSAALHASDPSSVGSIPTAPVVAASVRAAIAAAEHSASFSSPSKHTATVAISSLTSCLAPFPLAFAAL